MHNILCKHRCGILWFIIKKNIYSLCSHFWYRYSNFLSDENSKGVVCYVNKVAFGLHLKMGLEALYPGDYRVGAFT